MMDDLYQNRLEMAFSFLFFGIRSDVTNMQVFNHIQK
jgi:hypothetical protein